MTVQPKAIDLRYARRAKKAGAKWSLRIVWEARRARVPISWLFALIEQETGFRNVFGCDWGPGRAYCHEAVTREKVQALLRSGLANGVGPGQLTSPEYVRRADRYGGAHVPRHNIRVAAEVLREKTGGDMHKAWRYNGSPVYQGQIETKQRHWHRVLMG